MARVGDRERERAAASLKDHFVKGRLSLDELGARLELALNARNRSDLHAASRGLPALWQRGDELVATGAGVLRKGVRLLAFLATAAAWAICSVALAVPFAVLSLAVGPSAVLAAVFAALWVALSCVVWRPWFRSRG